MGYQFNQIKSSLFRSPSMSQDVESALASADIVKFLLWLNDALV